MAHTIPLQLVQEGEQVMRICNACRYCEGFCAVFPAMERRHLLTATDLTYLANLCHDCRECLYSCQYAPPHEFAVDVPKLMASARRESYRRYAWPGALEWTFSRQWGVAAIAALLAPVLAVLFLLLFDQQGAATRAYQGPGTFYAVVPHRAMVGIFSALGLFVLVVCSAGAWRFSRDIATPGGPGRPGKPGRPGRPGGASARDWMTGLRDALTLRYLGGGGDGGGDGCAYPDEAASNARRRFHHLTFYGFLLCLAATTVAAFYENVLGSIAPYRLTSLPVVLGSLGGFGLLAGPAGLLWLKRDVPAEGFDATQRPMDVAFLALLMLTAATGFLVLAFRETAAMGTLLVTHLGVVAGLFVTMPYGKFVHGIYRTIALVRYARER